jgi:hypothetical protein
MCKKMADANETLFWLGVSAYAGWSAYRDALWCARNWKRGVFQLGCATRRLLGPSKADLKRLSEASESINSNLASLERFQNDHCFVTAAGPSAPPKAPESPSFSELTGQAALDYVLAAPKSERATLMAEAIRDGRLELDADGRPIVAKPKKRR